MFNRSKQSRRVGTRVAALVALAAAGVAAASPAYAADYVPDPSWFAEDSLNPANRVGDLILVVPAVRTLNTASGDPTTVTTTVGCPEGYRGGSRSLFFWSDGTRSMGDAAFWRGPAGGVGWGMDGNPVNVTSTYAAYWKNVYIANEMKTDATAEYVFTCEPDANQGNAVDVTTNIGDAKYFSVKVSIDTENNTWNPFVETSTPTIAISNATANVDGTATLTAAIAGDGGAATSGAVTFTGTYEGLATPITGTATVAEGTATWTTPLLDAGKSYAFTASYASNGNATYGNSEADGTATVTTVAEPVSPENTTITVTIPQQYTGIKMTVTEGDVALGTATLQDTSYVAQGTLGDVTVTDDRETRTAWTLNGVAGALTSGSDTIAASYLGWAPALVGTSNAGTAGAVVTAGSNGGLSTAKPLASAPAGASTSTTTVKAGITLAAPSTTPEGSYSAVVTLTLI